VILLAFIAGLAGGRILPQLAGAIGPFGTLWIRMISALVVPLVVALLITGVTSLADVRAVGRLGARVLLVFFALLATGSAFVALVTPSLLSLLRVTHESAGALGVAALPANAPPATPGFWDWVGTLIPANPVAAAADGTLLPLVVFTVAFALAVTRLAPQTGAPVVGFFRGIADAMLQLVAWVLWTAPAGVFALAYALGARAGMGSAHALIALVTLVTMACLAYTCALYVLAVVIGRIPLLTFARAIARAQVVAFSTRSSLASLPAMIQAGETRLGLPPAVTGFVLPLAVSTFKLGATIAIVTSTLFLARLYGVPVTASQVTSIAVSAVLLSFSIPGIPAGVMLIMIPVLTSVGIPAEGVGILLAVDVIPDMVRTFTNVTADMTAAVIVARSMPRGEDVVAPA
jgi:Na+/H+-dicarboxylate symporter